MNFGPLELEACGENNFTMKALGLLAFRPDLRTRFIACLLPGRSAEVPGEDISVLFFSRIGEGFFREAIEREWRDGMAAHELEERLNGTLGLPAGFRWPRNVDGKLTQPAKWQQRHIQEALAKNGRAHDHELEHRLAFLQDCLNTEPDLVLQWGNELAIIEIKVLSAEGALQLDRQKQLGEFIGQLLGWRCHFFFIGPEYGASPSLEECTFVPWRDIAAWFSDVPEIRDYISQFAFFYRGRWRSMLSAETNHPGVTAYDLFNERPRSVQLGATTNAGRIAIDAAARCCIGCTKELPDSANVCPDCGARITPGDVRVPTGSLPSRSVAVATPSPSRDPWHFSHLGREYFEAIAYGCRRSGAWPLQYIWIGRTGVAYAEIARGRKVNPNWMVEDVNGQHRTRTGGFDRPGTYDPGRMTRWTYEEIAAYFRLDDGQRRFG